MLPELCNPPDSGYLVLGLLQFTITNIQSWMENFVLWVGPCVS